MEQNIQDLLTRMTDVMKNQQETINDQQARISKLEAASSGSQEQERNQSVSEKDLDEVVKQMM